jgi:S-adenosylmethionine hydrolase
MQSPLHIIPELMFDCQQTRIEVQLAWRNSTVSLITLTTDFGLADSYVGVMKGVMLSLDPTATIVDISHDIAPQDVREAAYVVYTAYPYFPPDTVHVVVVDPGVGSRRKAIALQAANAHFVAPDNGVLSYMLAREEMRQAVSLTNSRYHRPTVSHTFHGRDIFAPVAAHLARGIPLTELGEPLTEIVTFSLPQPQVLPNGNVVGHVLQVDRFGNLILDVREGDPILGEGLVLEVAGRRIQGLGRTFRDVLAGEMLAYIGSSGHLEIAFREGNAAQSLGVEKGDKILLRRDEGREDKG